MSLVQFRPEAPRKKEAARRSAGRGRRAAGTKRRCGFSSFGRARPCQGRGSGFEPRNPLQSGGPAPALPRKGAAIPLFGRRRFSPFYADVAQVVAHILGKDEVTSSSLVISSKNPFGKRLSSFHNWMAVFYFLWKELCLHIYTYLKLLSLTTAGNRLPFSAKSQSIFCKVVL